MAATKHDFVFSRPFLNAPGFLGFAPDLQGTIDLPSLGAFVTNPVSAHARTPATQPRFLAYPGGILLHTGHPNPGLREAIRRYAPRWRQSPIPVVVHLLAEDPDSFAYSITALEEVEGVAGVGIGLPPEIDRQGLKSLLQAGLGELPLLVQLPPGNAVELATIAAEAGASAVSLGPPRGTLPGPDGQLVSGRLYGPSIFPLALSAVEKLSDIGIPVYASGGVSKQEEARALLDAGATGILLDSILWKTGANLPGDSLIQDDRHRAVIE